MIATMMQVPMSRGAQAGPDGRARSTAGALSSPIAAGCTFTLFSMA
jgi:hypothetical protein